MYSEIPEDTAPAWAPLATGQCGPDPSAARYSPARPTANFPSTGSLRMVP
jgi:hypothetical protein